MIRITPLLAALLVAFSLAARPARAQPILPPDAPTPAYRPPPPAASPARRSPTTRRVPAARTSAVPPVSTSARASAVETRSCRRLARGHHPGDSAPGLISTDLCAARCAPRRT